VAASAKNLKKQTFSKLKSKKSIEKLHTIMLEVIKNNQMI
jgi:hypothetical protein